MSNIMPGAYDPTLYPNLVRYRDPQPAMVIPPPRLNSGIPRHPLELVSFGGVLCAGARNSAWSSGGV